MNKKNNKGFTLLELLISIFILTIVIFLGYKVINKSTMDIKNQGNINKGQLTVNDMNEYLTKDLERSSSVVLSSNYLTQTNIFTDDSTQGNKITNENLKGAFINYAGGKSFDYSYNINYKENNFVIIYEVNITKKDEGNYNYTIKRIDTKDGVSITFINNEIIKKDLLQLPFEISLNSPYKVYLGYNGKNNEFEKHEFTITSRLNYFDDEGNEDTGNGDSDSIIPLNGDLIFEITKNESSNLDKYDFYTYTKYDMLDKTLSGNGVLDSREEFSGNFNINLNPSGWYIQAHVLGVSCDFLDERIKNIVGIRIQLIGNIEVNNFTIENTNINDINLTTGTIYKFEFDKTQRNIKSNNIKILSNEKVGNTSKFIMDFIYEEESKNY